MMKYISLILVSTVVVGCQNSVSSKKVDKGTNTSVKPKNITRPNNTNLRSSLLGKWGKLRDTDFEMSFDTSLVYYFGETDFCKYSLSGNKIRIEFPDSSTYDGFIKLAGKNELIMIGAGSYKGQNDTVYRK